MHNRPVIRNIVVMGDSLSDRGSLRKKRLLGFIPMSFILFFTAHQNKGRFTNAMTWDDDLGAMLAGHFMADNIHKQSFPHLFPNGSHEHLIEEAEHAADESDLLLAHDAHAEEELQSAFTLKNDAMIPYYGAEFCRTYCEGGLTASDWRHDPAGNLQQNASRKILSTLANKREQLISDDQKNKITQQQKAETLIIEWSGGNDLITVNASPTEDAAKKAVDARIENIEKLIAQGYKNFVLFELPDLSLTPRFQAKIAAEQLQAKKVCEYFNLYLNERKRELVGKYQHFDVKVETFKINPIFADVKAHPEVNGFTNTTDPFVVSNQYRQYRHDSVLPSKGYMFWDDIHPTGHMHALLAEKFRERYENKFDFQPPAAIKKGAQHYYEQFINLYRQQVEDDRKGLFGCMRRSRLMEELGKKSSFHGDEDLDQQFQQKLAAILTHGLYHRGTRTHNLLRELGWVDKNGQINLAIPELQAALHASQDLQARQNHLRRAR